MKSDRHWPVAIVGGGFSGTMTAAQLARKGIASVIIEREARAGLGAAYSTTDPAHLLNVPAGNMSAWADVPDDFARRVGDGAVFAQRREYGGYLRSILDEVMGNGCVDLLSAQATHVERQGGRWTVAVEGQLPICAEALVLATGNQPPGRLPVLEGAGARLVANPWTESARAATADVVASGEPVLIVGAGLTMVDVLLSLYFAGHQGEVLAVSRRGLIPRGHSATQPAAVGFGDIPSGSVTALLSWLRRTGAEAGWRAAVDSLRPHSSRIWQSLGAEQQRRFIRHARPWWDVHRHRIAPQVADLLVDLIGAGRLRVVAGRVQSCTERRSGVDVTIARRSGEAAISGEFAFIFNCTGPLGSISQSKDPLLKRMLGDGCAKPDELGIGLAVDDRSRVAGADRLWAVGPLSKGAFWEIIAVPDIRVQAAAVAEDIAAELAQ